MAALVWGGAALTLLGVVGLIACISMVVRARRAGLSDEEMKAKLQTVVVWNLIAVLVSGLGLGAVIMGVILS